PRLVSGWIETGTPTIVAVRRRRCISGTLFANSQARRLMWLRRLLLGSFRYASIRGGGRAAGVCVLARSICPGKWCGDMSDQQPRRARHVLLLIVMDMDAADASQCQHSRPDVHAEWHFCRRAEHGHLCIRRQNKVG